jgi:hypothetical protein
LRSEVIVMPKMPTEDAADGSAGADLLFRLGELAREAKLAESDDSAGTDPLEAAREKIQYLELALDHRTAIGQATGIIMERFGISADAAFATLRRLSSEQDRKVYEIAKSLTETGLLPGRRGHGER